MTTATTLNTANEYDDAELQAAIDAELQAAIDAELQIAFLQYLAQKRKHTLVIKLTST
jgi:hypothetical protein